MVANNFSGFYISNFHCEWKFLASCLWIIPYTNNWFLNQTTIVAYLSMVATKFVEKQGYGRLLADGPLLETLE